MQQWLSSYETGVAHFNSNCRVTEQNAVIKRFDAAETFSTSHVNPVSLRILEVTFLNLALETGCSDILCVPLPFL